MARHWKILGALSLLGAFAVGCSDQAEATKTSDPVAQGAQAVSQATATPDAARADATKAADARGDEPCDKGRGGHMGRGHHPGPDFLLRAALNEIELTADQKTTIEAAVAKLDPRGKERAPREHGNPLASLAAGVRAGKLDASALPARPAPDAAMEAHRNELVSAIQTLHTTLTPAQRTALVAAVEKRAEHFGPPPGLDRKADRAADGDKGDRKGGFGRGHHGPPGPMFLLRDLDLTEQQQTAIKQALDAQRGEAPDPEAMKQRFEAMRAGMKARLATFATDSFDAKAFLAPPEGAEAGKHFGPDHMVKDLATIVPLLTAAQREKLATQLEKGPGGFGPPGGFHGRAPQGTTEL